MIAFVRGQVAAVTLSSAVLEVGGVGLELMCTPGTLSTLRTGQQATLPTSMVVREDSLTLFGFLDEDEKSCFELVQTASGVGPKLAQAMIAVLTPDDLRRAVAGDDVKTLTRVPGIGQKGAQRIILARAGRARRVRRRGGARGPADRSGAGRGGALQRARAVRLRGDRGVPDPARQPPAPRRTPAQGPAGGRPRLTPPGRAAQGAPERTLHHMTGQTPAAVTIASVRKPATRPRRMP